MIPLCKEIEEKLIKYIWRNRTIARRSTPSVISGISAVPSSNSVIGSGTPSFPHTPQSASNAASQTELNEKQQPPQVTRTPSKRGWWSWRLQPREPPGAAQQADPEKGAAGKREERKLMLFGPLYAGIGAALALCGSFLFNSFSNRAKMWIF